MKRNILPGTRPANHRTSRGALLCTTLGLMALASCVAEEDEFGLDFDRSLGDTAVDCRIEAEDAVVDQPMKVRSDGKASGESYVVVPEGKGSNYNDSTFGGSGAAEFEVDAPSSGKRTLWARALAPNGRSNSFYVTLDDELVKEWSAPTGSSWKWSKVGTVDLSKGINSLIFRQREDGTQLDAIAISNTGNPGSLEACGASDGDDDDDNDDGDQCSSGSGVVKQFDGGYATYKANEYGQSSSALETNLPIGRHDIPAADEYYLDYWLKYRSGWIEGRGGKLPGFTGGKGPTGSKPVTPDGWAVRYMWDPMRAYINHQDRPGNHSESFSWDSPSKLPVNKWQRLTMRVKVNTNNKKNGEVEMWLNGKQVYLKTDLRLRGDVSSSKARVDEVIIQTFRGGSNSSWSVDEDTTIDFKKFYVLDCKPEFDGASPGDKPHCAC